MTKSGFTAFRVSGNRPKAKIFIVTNDKNLGNIMNIVWGIRCIFYDKTENIDLTLENIENILVENNHLKKDDKYIVTASMPEHWEGHTNMMKVNIVNQAFYKSISTCFGLGYISPLPGTLTSFLTVIIIWTIQTHFSFEVTTLFILFTTLIGYISVEKNPDKVSDPKEIVIDEFIGQSLVLVFLPLTYQNYILGFILFRFFDIYKPMPINYFEKKYPNAFGIIFDDIIHVKQSYNGVYVSKREPNDLIKIVDYIINNYSKIQKEMEKNDYPTKEQFVLQLKKIINS